jgi:hypothetical protein
VVDLHYEMLSLVLLGHMFFSILETYLCAAPGHAAELMAAYEAALELLAETENEEQENPQVSAPRMESQSTPEGPSNANASTASVTRAPDFEEERAQNIARNRKVIAALDVDSSFAKKATKKKTPPKPRRKAVKGPGQEANSQSEQATAAVPSGAVVSPDSKCELNHSFPNRRCRSGRVNFLDFFTSLCKWTACSCDSSGHNPGSTNGHGFKYANTNNGDHLSSALR